MAWFDIIQLHVSDHIERSTVTMQLILVTVLFAIIGHISGKFTSEFK